MNVAPELKLVSERSPYMRAERVSLPKAGARFLLPSFGLRPYADQMNPAISVQDVIDELARDPLRNIVLLKQLLAYPEHSKVHRASGAEGRRHADRSGYLGQSL